MYVNPELAKYEPHRPITASQILFLCVHPDGASGLPPDSGVTPQRFLTRFVFRGATDTFLCLGCGLTGESMLKAIRTLGFGSCEPDQVAHRGADRKALQMFWTDVAPARGLAAFSARHFTAEGWLQTPTAYSALCALFIPRPMLGHVRTISFVSGAFYALGNDACHDFPLV